jgi:hypothetical protein
MRSLRTPAPPSCVRIPVGHHWEMISPLDRPSARVIVIDRTGSVLLVRIDDPMTPNPRSVTTRGGHLRSAELLSEQENFDAPDRV